MKSRDPACFNEASTKADAGEAIDKIPAHVRQFVEEHWNGRLPAREAFAAEVTELACMAMVSLVREGKLAALLGELPAVEDGRRMATVITAEVLSARNPRLTAQCADIAFDLRVQRGRGETEIAAEHGLTRATVSGICRQLVEIYSDKPGTGMKSEAAVEQYRMLRKGKRAKPMPATWEFAEKFSSLITHEQTKPGTKRR